MAVRIPTRGFLAYVDKGLLPFPGGVTSQPYTYWRFIEEMYAGYRREKNSRAQAEAQAAIDRAARRRGG